MTEDEVALFQETVWGHYARQGRYDLPWRLPGADGGFDPYLVLVSEIMLQQTQVHRVVPKFQEFISAFPAVEALAAAPLSQVLTRWSGLGYNRRAKFLWQAAQRIAAALHGRLPESRDQLMTLPGVGPNTAGAILAYAYNQPVVFVETNIRTVFIHHFFSDNDRVADRDIETLVAATLPDDDARNWYWALMDYGTFLKQTAGNASRRSKTYAKQPTFAGSRRQIRGRVLRLLVSKPYTKAQLVKEIADDRLEQVLQDLAHEGFIKISPRGSVVLR